VLPAALKYYMSRALPSLYAYDIGKTGPKRTSFVVDILNKAGENPDRVATPG